MKYSYEAARPSDSPFVETIWQLQSDESGDFTSTAAIHSGIVITRVDGKTTVTVRGPETRATTATTPANAEFTGIVFKPGTYMPSLLPRNLIDLRDAHLPVPDGDWFWLENAAWEIPTFENADTFIERLVRDGLLAHDPVVEAVLQGERQAFSPRALQYRFVRATGLSHKVIQQIERAKRAAALLEQGSPILDIAFDLGFYDQSHLTNSLKRFLGQTPAQIARLSQPE